LTCPLKHDIDNSRYNVVGQSSPVKINKPLKWVRPPDPRQWRDTLQPYLCRLLPLHPAAIGSPLLPLHRPYTVTSASSRSSSLRKPEGVFIFFSLGASSGSRPINLGCDYWLASQLNQDGRRGPGSPASHVRERNGIHFCSPRARLSPAFFCIWSRQAHPFVQAQQSVCFLHLRAAWSATNQLNVACSGPGWVSYGLPNAPLILKPITLLARTLTDLGLAFVYIKIYFSSKKNQEDLQKRRPPWWQATGQ
jgi:hypothetical protein